MILRAPRKQGRSGVRHLSRALRALCVSSMSSVSRLALACLLAAETLSASSCASSTPPSEPAEKPLYVNGVRQRPLTVDEAASTVGNRSTELSKCYGRERVNLDSARLSDYVFQIRIPTDGTKPEVSVQKATDPKQKMLESCLLTVLTSTRFPAHIGKPLTINVPIEAPQ
ncbi:MAG: hypothetical protein H6729_05130 [Deltaproteobacteria bacterium]|nr:hypothetical protein [Deltaproteobacteria bacterium]